MPTILLSVKTANLFNIKTQNKQAGGPEIKRTVRGAKEIKESRARERESERESESEKDSVSILAVKGKSDTETEGRRVCSVSRACLVIICSAFRILFYSKLI